MLTKPTITEVDTHRFKLEQLAKNEAVWIEAAPFSLYVKRTDEGLVVDIYDRAEENCVASTYAFDGDVAGDEDAA